MKRLIRKARFKKVESFVYTNESSNAVTSIELKYPLTIFTESEKTNIPQIDKQKYFKAYAVFDDTKLIHVSFIFKNNLLANQLGFKQALTIGECVTNANYRGQGIYPNILQQIRTDFAYNNIIVFVHPTNQSSIKGIERAGFKKLYQFIMYRFLGINLYTKKIN
jgi:RimJ/RimL family protein N-acetyltransferase